MNGLKKTGTSTGILFSLPGLSSTSKTHKHELCTIAGLGSERHSLQVSYDRLCSLGNNLSWWGVQVGTFIQTDI